MAMAVEEGKEVKEEQRVEGERRGEERYLG